MKIHLFLILLLVSIPGYADNLWQIVEWDEEGIEYYPKNEDGFSLSKRITLNRIQLSKLSPTATITLPINNSLSYLATIKRIKPNANGSNAYIGEITLRNKLYPLILTIGKNSFYGFIATDEKTYLLEGVDNTGTITEERQNINSTNEDFIIPISRTEAPSVGFREKAKTTSNVTSSKHDKAEVIANIANINILFVYSQDVRAKFNNEPITRIHHIIDVTNQIFFNSGVYINIQLAATLEVDYSSDGSLFTALKDITKASSPIFSEIRKLRYETAADMVMFLSVSSNSSNSGYAWANGENGSVVRFADKMYSAISLDKSDYVAAHELGHNLGLHHSRQQDPHKGVTFDFALGYGVDNQFVTVMAYQSVFSTTNKIYQFSNPDQECEFLPCGIAKGNTLESADASYALNLVRFQAENLYQDSPKLTLTQNTLLTLHDQALQACINDLYPEDIYPYTGMINDLDCRIKSIDSLVGLSAFENVHTLNLYYNFLTDLSPLANLTRLRWLNINANNVHDISSLFHLNEWDYLNLLNNPIYCWQLRYFELFETVYDWSPPTQCDGSDDLNDYDYDGVNNLDELDNNENPTLNSNGVGKLQFSQNVYRFDEHTGTIQIKIERVQGNVNTLTASIEVEDQTTNRDADYVISQQSLSFEHGESSNFLELKVIDDEEAESIESFNIKLVSKHNTDSAKVEIIDNDYIPRTTENKSSGGGIYGIYLLFLTLLFWFVRALNINTQCKRDSIF
ncbi:Calx-beta domain-containing protein [Thalassotalea psychrophila]|uniref:Calx-beta domain-containing protein n=1 Tax=Thalassotalea psychrophila TaxID=3065647 RepID=A0ABY9TVJ9_9GAMM|nr:Calx-beta domain-containing protein [Colwelliaceae bacterium SQ149]